MINTEYMKAGAVLLMDNNREIFYVCNYPDDASRVIIKYYDKHTLPQLAVMDKSSLRVKPVIKKIILNIYRKDNIDAIYSYNSYELSVIGRENMQAQLGPSWRFIGTYGIDTPI